MKIAVCPGSFDPVTIGHMDIIHRTTKLFDKVIIVVMQNIRKQSVSFFTVEERLDFLRRCTKDMKNVEIDAYSGLLAEYTKQKNATAIVKGLRAVSDYEDEFQQALTNKKMNPAVETVFMAADSENMFLSSSVVRQVCMLGGDISEFVPAEIYDDIVRRLHQMAKDL